MQPTALEEVLRDRPDDADAWRAYSDWLDEHGDSRGTLIRLEQRLARTRPADRPTVAREIADLVADQQEHWDDGLPASAQVVTCRYGFATEVAVRWSDDIGEVVAQVLRARFVTTLRITPDVVDDEAEILEDDDYWDEGPGRADRPGSVDVAALQGVDLGRLSTLDLSYVDLGPDGAEALAGLFHTGRLRTLDVRYCRLNDRGLAALAASPHLGGLRHLSLQRNRLTAAGVRSLHRFTELEELDLRYNDVGDKGAEALLAAPFVGSLTRLWLYRTDVGADGARKLAQAANLPVQLRSLWRCV